MRGFLTLFCSINFFAITFAQPTNYIEVYGTAMQQVDPDFIVYQVHIEQSEIYQDLNFDDNYDPMKRQQVREQANLKQKRAYEDLLKALKKAGLKEENILDDPYTVPARDILYTKDKFAIGLDNLKALERFVKVLKNTESLSGQVVFLDCSFKDKIVNNLQLEALQNARSKAEKMARNMNLRLGNTLQIQELAYNPKDDLPNWTGYRNLPQTFDNPIRYEKIKSNQHKIKLNASVLIRMEIK